MLACLLAATLLAVGPPLAAQAPRQAPAPAPVFDPSDLYFQGWLQVKDAEQLEKDGDFAGALEKLERARQLFDAVARSHPDWKKRMVAGRATSTAESIARVKPQADEQSRPARRAMAELEGPLPRDPDGKVHQPGGVRRLPTDPPKRLPGTPARPLDPQATRIAQLQQEVRRLNQELERHRTSAVGQAAKGHQDLEAMTRQRNLLNSQLRKAEAELTDLRANLASRPVRSEFDRLNQRLAALEQERDATARSLAQSQGARRAAEQRIEAIETELAEVRQQAADLERNLATERTVANEVIRGQQQQLRQLRETIDGKDRELASARSRIGELEHTLEETRDAFAEMRVERDALLRERDHMAALLKLNEAGRIQELIEQNMALAKELRLADERVERVKANNEETKEGYTEALRDLAIAKARIINLQKENQAQRTRLAELQQRLERADAELAAGQDQGNPEEVAMLRDIIRRQLRIQERRRQARDLLLAQVKRLGLDDPQLDDAMALLHDDDLQLSPEESRLINDRRVDGEFVSPFAVPAGRRQAALSRVEQERKGLDQAGSRAFTTGRLAAAEELFDLILDAHPGHVPTLQKLGVVRLRRDDLAGSAEAFRDAVALDAENAYARRMLGVALYKLGSHLEAEAELRHAVAIDPADAKAHVYLGNATYRLGRTDEAEQHFKAAIGADPTLSEPHFNLAFLCADDGRRKEGRTHYQQALDNGATPDLDLETKLGL